MFNIVYNRGGEAEVSGGCIGFYIFLWELSVQFDGKSSVWSKEVLCCVVRCYIFILVYNRGSEVEVSGGCTII